MTKNLEDKKLVTKGAVKEALKKAGCWQMYQDGFEPCYINKFITIIDQLPAEPQSKDCVERDKVLEIISRYMNKRGDVAGAIIEIRNLHPVLPAHQARSVAEIEKAISTFDSFLFTFNLDARHLSENDNLDYKKFKREAGGFLAELLRWVLKGKQNTWTDKELLGEEESGKNQQ